jgi:hypothetical protein
MSTALIDIVREVQHETAPRPLDRPVARPRYPGDPFHAAERLESAMREAGVSAEDFREVGNYFPESRKRIGGGS